MILNSLQWTLDEAQEAYQQSFVQLVKNRQVLVQDRRQQKKKKCILPLELRKRGRETDCTPLGEETQIYKR